MTDKTETHNISASRPLPLSRRVRHRVECIATEALISFCSVVPLRALRRIGSSLGWFGWRILGIRRRVVMENLTSSLPDTPGEARYRIAAESYKNMGRALMEFAAFRGLSGEKLLGMVDIEGLENFDMALEHGNGAILFTGHFGNWELLGAVIARCGYPIYVTDTNHSNRLVHEIISDLRTRQGMRIVSPSEPLTRITQLLAGNQFVAYLADQDARRDGIFVDFLGRPASTVRGPAIFSIRKKCPIVPGFLIRKGCDRHRAIFEKPLWPDPRLAGREAIQELTQRFTELLERYVRAYPEQYFWTHRRWKTRPDGRVVR